MYIQSNIVALWYKISCRGKATMRSVCVVALPIAVNNVFVTT